MTNMKFFGEWLDSKRTEYLKMRVQYVLGDKSKDDGLWEWIFAHGATFSEVFDNFRAAGGLNAPSPVTPEEVLNLIAIVEGVKGAIEHGTWRDEKTGMRLKGTPEWVAYYNAVKLRLWNAHGPNAQSEGDEA